MIGYSTFTPQKIMMQPLNRYITVVTGITLAVLLLVSLPARSTPSGQVEQIIAHLITYVSKSELRFVRNASEYTPQEAAAHMEKKYQHFRDDIDTAEDFIKLCATKSLLTGKPYLVVDRQGNKTRTSDWLRAELAAWQGHSQ